MVHSDLISRDLAVNWHPCSQMKDYETFAPIEVNGAKGSHIITAKGQKIIDANSSWWCKSLGHGHPRIKEALIKQAEQFEHVIFANTTNESVVELSEKLGGFFTGLNKVFYASEGSTAVEIALKMSLQAQQIKGHIKKNKFMALQNGYHGESSAALGVSALGLYRDQYLPLLPEGISFIEPGPYVSGKEDLNWTDSESAFKNIESELNEKADSLAGIILEPMLQGAGGMLLYSADFLKRLRTWCNANNVYLIADEILTGFGRTGKAMACEHAGITPDFLLLSKGLTSGWLPFSACVTSTEVYDLFYGDYSSGKAFLHSNTFTGNALGVAVALETLKIYEDENIFSEVKKNESFLLEQFHEVSNQTGVFKNIRNIGAMVAGDLILPENKKEDRVGYEIFQEAVKLGALLRPLGNTIYWLPPLNTPRDVISDLKNISIQAIQKVL